MPKQTITTTEEKIEDALRPYQFHGVDIEEPSRGHEAISTCPFCDHKKFSVNIENGLFRCWSGSCAKQGNITVFIRDYYDLCKEETTSSDYDKLAALSGFVSGVAAEQFGCVLSINRDEWLVPGYNHEKHLSNLYRFMDCKDKDGEWKKKLLPTPTLGHQLFNFHNYDDKKSAVHICEGWRDAIAWIETLAEIRMSDSRSVLDDVSVVAVPGVTSFKIGWANLFADKNVYLLFDNDHPKYNDKGKAENDPAGVLGIKRTASILDAAKHKPASINFLDWSGGLSKGYSTDYRDGMDLRDVLSQGLIDA